MTYTNTDSLILNIQTEGLYKYYHKCKDHLDFKDRKVIGLFKDETPGRVITEIVALILKTYCYDKVTINTNDVKTDRRAK